MPWTTDELDRLSAAPELQIAGRRDDGTLRRDVTIWAVVVDGEVYVRSVRGADGGWYRGVRRSLEGRISSGGVERDVTFAEVARDNGVQQGIDAAYARKYPGSPGSVDRINADAARAATLRVDPA